MNKELATVPVDTGTVVQIHTDEIPWYVGLNIGQALMEAIHRDMQNPETQADYQRWKTERASRAILNSSMEAVTTRKD